MKLGLLFLGGLAFWSVSVDGQTNQNSSPSVTVYYLTQSVKTGQVLTTNLLREVRIAHKPWPGTRSTASRDLAPSIHAITGKMIDRYLGRKFIRAISTRSNEFEVLQILTPDMFGPALGDYPTPEEKRSLSEKPPG